MNEDVKRERKVKRKGTFGICARCGLALIRKDEKGEKYCVQCDRRLKREHPKAYAYVERRLGSM